MRLSGIVMLLVALVFGVAAAMLSKSWLESQTPEPTVVERPAPRMGSIVVAAEPLRFGTELTAAMLRELEWPADAVPRGAYVTIADVLDGQDKRVVLSAMEANEPLLERKITGPGQRATLSALVAEPMKAVTIRVSDVQGVAGFVLPGERVDVLMTRIEMLDGQGAPDAPREAGYAEVLLQNVRVLAVDQLVDERVESPTLVKAVTIEVTIEQAQKLALAGTVGQLSLALRSAGSLASTPTRRISIGDLGVTRRAGPSGAPTTPVVVTRATTRETYNVPPHFSSRRAAID